MTPLFERLPPHDIDAEEAVLASCLVPDGWDLITEVVTVVRPRDFFREKNRFVFEAVLDVWERGEQVNTITVAHVLAQRDQLETVGGQTYLNDIIAQLATALGGVHYARIVRRVSAARDLIGVGFQIQEAAYQNPDAWQDTVDDGVERLLAIAEGSVTERTRSSHQILVDEGLIDEIEQHMAEPWRLAGKATGLGKLNYLIDGWQDGAVYIVAAETSLGKALALDTPLPTPDGWTTMGDVRVGDRLIGDDGKPATVTAVTEVMHGRECFEVCFSDGTVIIADADHQWLTETWGSRLSAYKARAGKSRQKNQRTFAKVRTTKEIAESLTVAAVKRPNHSIKNARPMDLPERDLPIDPYLLGVWLGDGSSAIGALTCFDQGIIDNLLARGVPVRRPKRRPTSTSDNTGLWTVDGLTTVLKATGLLFNKHIPDAYLRASEEQRRALMAGLLDTDGYATREGSCQFAVTSERLALGFRELASTLGYRTSLTTKRVKGRTEKSSTCYMVFFTPPDTVFWLERKAQRQNLSARRSSRYITDVKPVESVPVRCLQVDNESHLYLAGPTMIPTHNTQCVLNRMLYLLLQGVSCLLFSTEMNRRQVEKRLAYMIAELDPAKLRQANRPYTLEEREKVRAAMDVADNLPFHVCDMGEPTLSMIRTEVRRWSAKGLADVVIIDHIDMVGKKGNNRTQELEATTAGLKGIAQDMKKPLIVVSHMSRANQNNVGQKLGRLKNAGSKEQDADVVMFLEPVQRNGDGSIDRYLTSEEARALIASQQWIDVELDVQKNRMGMTGRVPLVMSWLRGGIYYEPAIGVR